MAEAVRCARCARCAEGNAVARASGSSAAPDLEVQPTSLRNPRSASQSSSGVAAKQECVHAHRDRSSVGNRDRAFSVHLPVLPAVLATSAVPAGFVDPATAAGAPLPVQPWRPFVVIAGLASSFAVFTLIGASLLSARGCRPTCYARWASGPCSWSAWAFSSRSRLCPGAAIRPARGSRGQTRRVGVPLRRHVRPCLRPVRGTRAGHHQRAGRDPGGGIRPGGAHGGVLRRCGNSPARLRLGRPADGAAASGVLRTRTPTLRRITGGILDCHVGRRSGSEFADRAQRLVPGYVAPGRGPDRGQRLGPHGPGRGCRRISREG